MKASVEGNPTEAFGDKNNNNYMRIGITTKTLPSSS